MRRWQLAVGILGLTMLGGCGGVQIAPTPELPRALVEKVPANVGLVISPEQRNLVHTETRGGVSWSVTLGQGQQQLARDILGATFNQVTEFADVDAARNAAELQAVFEPITEQYSFATAQETGGGYVVVTIRYRINVFAPNGERYDSLTLTGYGTAMSDALGSSGPMEEATKAAMRDAASRFLTQFPATQVAAALAGGKRLEVSAEDALKALAAAGMSIEALPIRVSRRINPDWKPMPPVTQPASPAATVSPPES
jgi:hypothetical protein